MNARPILRISRRYLKSHYVVISLDFSLTALQALKSPGRLDSRVDESYDVITNSGNEDWRKEVIRFIIALFRGEEPANIEKLAQHLTHREFKLGILEHANIPGADWRDFDYVIGSVFALDPLEIAQDMVDELLTPFIPLMEERLETYDDCPYYQVPPEI